MGRKMVDLTGQTFGLLTVERIATDKEKEEYFLNKQFKPSLWVCRCSCGNIVMKVGSNLLSDANKGYMLSCGCWRKLKYNNKNSEILGKKFGRLTPISFNYEPYHHERDQAVFLCECECGNTTKASKYDLTSGHKSSCGCVLDEHNKIFLRDYKKINLIGQTFGRLHVLEETDERDAAGSIMWLCKCECGSNTNVSTTHLTSGATQSCGCANSRGEEIISKILSKSDIKYETQYHFDNLRGKSKKFLQFDFAIFNEDNSLSHLIEYDGEQHFKPTSWSVSKSPEENLKEIQQRDERKNEYCLYNSIPLIRIPYTHFKKLCLEDLLLESTTFLYTGGN